MSENVIRMENASLPNSTEGATMRLEYNCGADPLVFHVLGMTLGTVGLIGNVCFMFVVVRVKSMQTATNHYLINLAAADLLYLMCLWFLYLCVLVNGDGACFFTTYADARCVIGMVVDIAVLTSNFSVTFIGIERYVAITHPFRARRLCTKGKTALFNVLMWILALVIKLPSAVACHVDDPPESIYIAIYIIFITVCFISLCMVTVLYTLTAYHFKQTTKAMREFNDSRHQAPSHDKAVVRLCVLTTVIYFLCLFPKELAFILQLFKQLGGPIVSLNTTFCIHNVSVILLMVHSAANPIVYNVMSSRYRQAFKTALMSCCGINCSGRQCDKTYYTRTNGFTDKTVASDVNQSIHRQSKKYPARSTEIESCPRTTSM